MDSAPGETPSEAFWYDRTAIEFADSLARLAAAYEFDRAQQEDPTLRSS